MNTSSRDTNAIILILIGLSFLLVGSWRNFRDLISISQGVIIVGVAVYKGDEQNNSKTEDQINNKSIS